MIKDRKKVITEVKRTKQLQKHTKYKWCEYSITDKEIDDRREEDTKSTIKFLLNIKNSWS